MRTTFPRISREVRVVRIHNRKRKTRVTLEIAELLASCGLTETDVVPIPVEPDRSIVWLPFRPDSGDMCQGCCVQQISVALGDKEHYYGPNWANLLDQ